jgi:hypothetical protein
MRNEDKTEITTTTGGLFATMTAGQLGYFIFGIDPLKKPWMTSTPPSLLTQKIKTPLRA